MLLRMISYLSPTADSLDILLPSSDNSFAHRFLPYEFVLTVAMEVAVDVVVARLTNPVPGPVVAAHQKIVTLRQEAILLGKMAAG